MSGKQTLAGVPVVDPVTARKGRFLVGRRKWAEIESEANRLRVALALKRIDLGGFLLVGTFMTSRREWQVYLLSRDEFERAAARQRIFGDSA